MLLDIARAWISKSIRKRWMISGLRGRSRASRARETIAGMKDPGGGVQFETKVALDALDAMLA